MVVWGNHEFLDTGLAGEKTENRIISSYRYNGVFDLNEKNGKFTRKKSALLKKIVEFKNSY